MWILEPLKNQSESWKSSGNLFLKKGTNPVSLSWTWGPEKSKGFCCYYVPSKTWLALHCTSGENWEADKGDMYKEQKLRIAKKTATNWCTIYIYSKATVQSEDEPTFCR